VSTTTGYGEAIVTGPDFIRHCVALP